MPKTIIHIDLNSCFATCEQQDNPAWRFRPLAVVQDSGKRSVIIASSIEAKTFGIETGFSVWQARAVCPQIIIVPAHFDRYVHYAKKFRAVCGRYSNQVEVFSIDELFLDVTQTAHLFGGAENIARLLKYRLTTEVGDYLRCSIGIAPNKMLAKLASGSQKPDGLVQVTPKEALSFLDDHPLWHICGIGKRVTRRLNALGIYTIAQMRQVPERVLTREFGIMGKTYFQWAWGQDDSQVAPAGFRSPDKSYGNQLTLPQEVSFDEAVPVLLWLSWQVGFRLRKHAMAAKSVSLYIMGSDGHGFAQKTVTVCTGPLSIYQTALALYEKKLTYKGPIRFVGVSVSNLLPAEKAPLPLLMTEAKWNRLLSAWDAIAEKYDPFYLKPARLLSTNIHKGEFNGFSKKF